MYEFTTGSCFKNCKINNFGLELIFNYCLLFSHQNDLNHTIIRQALQSTYNLPRDAPENVPPQKLYVYRGLDGENVPKDVTHVIAGCQLSTKV